MNVNSQHIFFLGLFSLYDGIIPSNTDLFDVSIGFDGNYKILVRNKTWLQNGPAFLQAESEFYTTANGSLRLIRHSPDSGADAIGLYTADIFKYKAGSILIGLNIRKYREHSLVVFEQFYEVAVTGTFVGNKDHTISGFPVFDLKKSNVNLGFLSFGGHMLGDTNKKIGVIKKDSMLINCGMEGEPLVLFDHEGDVLIVSSFNEFMASSCWLDSKSMLNWGIMGMVNSLPSGFSVLTSVLFSSQSINNAFQTWGSLLRKWYRKTNLNAPTYLTSNYLVYWTANGAYYYYNTEKHKNYEETIIDVYKYAKSAGIPFRNVEYDSWWYYKGVENGVTRWESMPNVFPHGLISLFNITGWPVIGHNRWWSSKTPYAKQNGGRFNFIIDGDIAIPNDQSFWDWLMGEGKKWGLVNYEQDWLNIQLLNTTTLLTDVRLGATWLNQMGAAAMKHGVTIEYCMANSRHGLQSLLNPTVTQIRVSDDYFYFADQWKIGITSMFAEALGLVPFKDNFWTTSDQPGNPYGKREPFPALHAVVSTLSTGPVAPGDAIGRTNVSLLMRCCNIDGLILKPSKPATAINAQIIQAAFQDGSGPVGEVTSTVSYISGFEFGTILAADLHKDFHITPALAGFQKISKIYRDTHPLPPRTASVFSAGEPLLLSGCSRSQFCLYHTTPKLNLKDQELLLFGETSKFVPMSPQRTANIEVSTNDTRISLRGGAREVVVFWVSLAGRLLKFSCKLSKAGTATLSIVQNVCWTF